MDLEPIDFVQACRRKASEDRLCIDSLQPRGYPVLLTTAAATTLLATSSQRADVLVFQRLSDPGPVVAVFPASAMTSPPIVGYQPKGRR